MRIPPKLAAAVSAVLFASTLGVLIAVAAFGVIRMVEQMGEGLSLVPSRWGENNPGLLLQISGAIALPVVAWFVVWFYKKAVTSEQALQDYHYAPPEAPKHAGKR
ncbi:MAG: hypothetical protein EXR11_00770 [Rhodospirillaceae bacterium]|nr:hypothetical protein [Rhodospirillaceae bacterium]